MNVLIFLEQDRKTLSRAFAPGAEGGGPDESYDIVDEQGGEELAPGVWQVEFPRDDTFRKMDVIDAANKQAVLYYHYEASGDEETSGFIFCDGGEWTEVWEHNGHPALIVSLEDADVRAHQTRLLTHAKSVCRLLNIDWENLP